MARFATSMVLVGCLWSACTVSTVSVAAGAKPKQGKAAAQSSAKRGARSTVKRASRGGKKGKRPATSRPARLPRFYSQLDLTDAQREKILAIQATYRAKSQKLRKQLDTVVSDRQKELARVLKPAQRKKLKQLVARRPGQRGKGRKTATAASTRSKRRPKT